MNCSKCVLLMPCLMQEKPKPCVACRKRKCVECGEKCLCSFDGLNLFNDGLTEHDLGKLVKLFKGAFGEVGDYRKEYATFCRQLVEKDLEFVVEFYKWTVWFSPSFSVKIRLMFEDGPYKQYFKRYF